MTDQPDTARAPVAIRPLARADLPALARFAAAVPPHDLLFLARDIREPRVLEAWLAGVEAGEIDSFAGVSGDEIVATVASLSDPLSWSRHVWDVRLLVSPRYRNQGIGRQLLTRAIEQAVTRGAAKLTARMTPDQTGAITLFEETGFRPEALLRDQVRDAGGRLHDLAILACDPAREAALGEAFGA